MKRKRRGTRKHKLKLISHLAVETLKNFDISELKSFPKTFKTFQTSRTLKFVKPIKACKIFQGLSELLISNHV